MQENRQPPDREPRPQSAPKKHNPKAWAIGLILTGVFLVSCAVVTAVGGNRIWHRAAAFLGLSDFSWQAEQYPFAMHVLSVGKADAILLECRGEFMLVDGGTVDQGAFIRQYLARRGVERLRYIVNTHPDADHSGGLEEVLQYYSADALWFPVLPEGQGEEEKQALRTAIRRRRGTFRFIQAGDCYYLGAARVDVLAPITLADDSNNNSLVLRVTYGETTFLLMGDAETEEENSLLESGTNLAADVLKVGHHGSMTSTSEQFLEAVSPRYAAISVGKDRNELPRKEILQRLELADVAIYRTDLEGTLLFGSDGETVEVWVEQET